MRTILRTICGDIRLPFLTGLAAYVGDSFMGFLAYLRVGAGLVFGDGIAAFVTQPVVFAALLTFAAAVLQGAVKLIMHFTNNDYRIRALQAERALAAAVRAGAIR